MTALLLSCFVLSCRRVDAQAVQVTVGDAVCQAFAEPVLLWVAQVNSVSPAEVNCVVSEWSEWTVCDSVTPDVDSSWGHGTRSTLMPTLTTRRREVLSGSFGCPRSAEVAPCVPHFELAQLLYTVERFATVSQGNQDIFTLDAFFRDKLNDWKRDGVFVDVGAHNGVTFSNSYMLETSLGWHGVCLEPIERHFKRLARRRKCVALNACAYNRRDNVSFSMVSYNADMLSGITETYDPQHYGRIGGERGVIEEVTVPALPLRDVLRDAGITRVDFISIDTEGSELQVVQGIDFDAVFVDVLVIELNYFSLWEPLSQFLRTKGFVLIDRIDWDVVFRNEASLPPLAP